MFFYLNPQSEAVINDVHSELIAFYKEIGNGRAPEIYQFMETHENDEKTYYDVRDEMKTESDLDIAKRFYYLRKTCYRGMLRYNKSGKFNIPFGRYKTMNYSDIENCEDYHELLEELPYVAIRLKKFLKNMMMTVILYFLTPHMTLLLRITDTASSIKMITNVWEICLEKQKINV